MLIRRILHTIFSLWLAMLLLFGVTPMEALHACAPHQDTVHRQDLQGPVAEQQHHHCSFLSFELMAFDAPFAWPLLLPAPVQAHDSFLQLQDERAVQQAMALRESRGPPAA